MVQREVTFPFHKSQQKAPYIIEHGLKWPERPVVKMTWLDTFLPVKRYTSRDPRFPTGITGSVQQVQIFFIHFPFFIKTRPTELLQNLPRLISMFFYLIFTIYCLYMISRQGHFDEWMRTAIGFLIKCGGLGFVGVSLQSDLQKYATYIQISIAKEI